MRKISFAQILVFMLLSGTALALAVATTWLLVDTLPLGDFRGVMLVISGIALLYVYALLVYRLFLKILPFGTGEIGKGSRAEFSYHVYLLFYLILFYPVMRSGAVPVPLMRLIYQALGARLGNNSYSSGIILDPPFIEIGDNTLVGQYALLVPHVIENDRLAHYPIRIGSGVTIGAQSTVLSGVTIGDGAMVATGSVVQKGTEIGPGEVWGGTPARLLDSPASKGDTESASVE